MIISSHSSFLDSPSSFESPKYQLPQSWFNSEFGSILPDNFQLLPFEKFTIDLGLIVDYWECWMSELQ